MLRRLSVRVRETRTSLAETATSANEAWLSLLRWATKRRGRLAGGRAISADLAALAMTFPEVSGAPPC